MSLAVTAPEREPRAKAPQPILNDVVIKVATVNGSGSQSANLILMRSIFYMGVPVSGKNMFPSNIAGLPTWFTIRANQEGWLARRPDTDIMIAMNAQTAAEDIAELRPGAILLLNESLKGFLQREDLTTYVVPFDEMVKEACSEGRLRKMVVNILYVGVMAHLLGIEMTCVEKAIQRQFRGKAKAAELNLSAARYGFEWAQNHLKKQERFRLEPSRATEGKLIIEGNQAAAIGAVFGGAMLCAWYPITPSSSLCEAFIDYARRYRHDAQTGQATYAVVQAEDELASMALVVGAGWAGARAFTATAGPGISLMAELAGLAYFAEIPAVIIDVQRMGPSTGLPTRTSQGDMLKAYHLSHGDCRHVLLIPASMSECYEFTMAALNLAERLQTLVFVMTDLDLGMNSWMCDPLPEPSIPIERGKVLSVEALERLGGRFMRYKDVDGDGIAWRTLPGTAHPGAAYFTRGTGHTEAATYSEKNTDWKENMDRLARKFETARQLVPPPIIETEPGAEIGLLAFGSTDGALREARHLLESLQGLPTDYLRLRGLPVNEAVRGFIERHRVTYVVEQNRDGQVAALLHDEFPDLADRIQSILHYDGLPIYAQTIIDQLLIQEKENGRS